MASESIAHEAEGQMGYRLRGREGERNNFFSKIQPSWSKISRQNRFSWLKLDFNPFFAAKKPAFSLLVGYNI